MCHSGKTKEELDEIYETMHKREKEVQELCENKTKICYRCKIEKPWTEYNLIKNKPVATCKECLKKPMTEEQSTKYFGIEDDIAKTCWDTNAITKFNPRI